MLSMISSGLQNSMIRNELHKPGLVQSGLDNSMLQNNLHSGLVFSGLNTSMFRNDDFSKIGMPETGFLSSNMIAAEDKRKKLLEERKRNNLLSTLRTLARNYSTLSNLIPDNENSYLSTLE